MTNHDPLAGLKRLIEEGDRRRAIDAERWNNLDEKLCMLCHAHGDDKRTLFVSYFYAIHEAVPEACEIPRGDNERATWGLQTCKACRAAFLGKLREWRDERIARRGIPMDHDGHDTYVEANANIPVRVDGAIQMMTAEEYEKHRRPTP